MIGEPHRGWVSADEVRRWWLHLLAMGLITLVTIATYFEVHSIARRLDVGGEEWRHRLDRVQEDLAKILRSHEEHLWTLERSEADR